MRKHSLRAKLSYQFDNFMARGGSSMFVILTVLFLATFLVLSLFRAGLELMGLASERGQGFFRQVYITFLQMTDPGNMAQDVESSPWLKIATVLSGFAGLILLSMLIGFITTALVRKMEDLRKGHSTVIESDHTLILGWSPQRVVEILRELIMANESEDNPAIVILAEKPKDEMDDYLKLVLPDTQNSRIVTRSGSPSNIVNLEIVAASSCRSAIVLAKVNEDAPVAEQSLSDAETIKTILALSSARGDEELNIVAELYNERNHEIVQASCRHPITVVDANDILAKIIVQTSRSVGLSVAYGEIFSFDGCEMYFHTADWGNVTFDEATFRFPDGVPMGIRAKNGDLSINPEGDRKLKEDDDLLILADDDSTIEFQSKPVAASRDFVASDRRLAQIQENELIIGYNRKVGCIIEQYADYVLEGSRIDLMVHKPSAEIVEEVEAYQKSYPQLKISLIDADPLLSESLAAAEPATRNNILILSGGEGDANQADAQTILILLLLRQMMTEYRGEGVVETRLITEVMDSGNQNLISEAGVKDFIISNRFISMLLAQISEEADIKGVYDDLFEEDGSEIYLKPMNLYFENVPDEVTFADCITIARKRNEICLGVKIKALEVDAGQNFGVDLIPEKNTKFCFQPDDCLVVVAEDET